MKADDLALYADRMVESFTKALELRDAAFIKRLALLEAREPQIGPAGKDGRDGVDGKDGTNGIDGKNGADGINGKDATPVDTTALADEIAVKVLGQIPAPVHGKDGRDGKDAEQLDVNDIVSKILGQIPPPIPGKDGRDGVDGKDGADGLNGKDGKDGIDGKDGADGLTIKGDPGEPGKDGVDGKDAPPVDTKALTDEIVQKVLVEIPPPIPGEKGIDGRDGIAGADGAAGLNGRDGVPGQKGENGLNGKDGADGFGLDDFSVEQVDSRTVRLKFESRDRTVLKDLHLPVPIYRGTFSRAVAYQKDDMVTYHNEVWIAVEDKAIDPPGTQSKAWKLAVRKGRDSAPVKL